MPNIAKDTNVVSTVPQVNAAERNSSSWISGWPPRPVIQRSQATNAHQDHGPGHHRGHGGGVAPAILARPDEAVGQAGQAQAGQGDPRDVDAGAPDPVGFWHQRGHGHQGEQHHRHVDQEDRAPPEVVQQPAAEQRADRVADEGGRP